METSTKPARRIASLLASATEIVDALGLGERLVAISHECDHPAGLLDRPRASRPRFEPAGLTSGEIDRELRRVMQEYGSAYEVDGELLATLAPDLILTQAVCEVCAVPTPGVERVVAERGLDARVLSLDAHTLGEIFATLRAVAAAAGVAERGEEVAGALEARLAAVERAVAGTPRPRVLALEWLDPPFAPGHWVPEQIRVAGGQNLLGHAGAHSEQLTWEEAAGGLADVLLIMPCGYGLEATRADADQQAERLAAVAPRAVAAGRAFVVDGSSYFNRSGPRVVRGVEILAGLLHPARFPPPLPSEAAVWHPTET